LTSATPLAISSDSSLRLFWKDSILGAQASYSALVASMFSWMALMALGPLAMLACHCL